MRKKLFSSFIVFALVLSLTFTSTSKVYATGGFGEIILGTGAVIAVEEAIAWTLLACGLTAGADAVYRNQDELKSWANARLEDIKKFGNDAIEFGSDVVAGLGGWFSDVANGVMDTGSKCWDLIKSWAGSVYASLSSAPSYPAGGNYHITFNTVQTPYMDLVAQGTVIAAQDSEYSGRCVLYSMKPFTVYTCDGSVLEIDGINTSYYEGMPFYRFTFVVGATYVSSWKITGGIDVDYTIKGPKDFIEKYGSLAGAGDLTTVGGVNDAYDNQQTLTDYDLLNKVGAGTHVGAGMIGLEWQQLMDKDKIDVDSNTGVATGTIAGSLSNVATGDMSWSDSLDKVGVVPVIGDNVIDDAGVTDKPRPSEKPNNPDMDGNYIFDLRHIFPFCLPFDLVDFLGCLSAPPEAPKFDIEIPTLNSDGSLKWHKMTLDFSQFDEIAMWLRNMELFAFIVGLVLMTRSKMIRG